MLHKLALFVSMLAFSAAAIAYCTSNTIITPDGRVIYCQTCCYGGNCTTTCV